MGIGPPAGLAITISYPAFLNCIGRYCMVLVVSKAISSMVESYKALAL